MFRRAIKAFDTLFVALVAWCAVQALAQDASPPGRLPPVTVTGAALSPIPQSSTSAATVVSGEEVQVGEITSVRDLTAQSPNLTVFDANNQRMPKFSVRGFRENNFGVGQPVVGLYVDGVPYFDLNSRGLALFDAEAIQFVRGDQGTLYGASGVGGVINVMTVQPRNETHGYIEGSYGNYNAQNYQLGLSGPIVTNKLLFGVNGLYALRDGFVYNNVHHDHPDGQDALGLRGVLTWTPSDPWVITLTADTGRDNDGFVPTYLPGVDSSAFNVSRNVNGYVHTDNIDEALKIGYLADAVRLSSVLTHRAWQQNIYQEIPPSTNETIGFTSPRLEAWTEELRAESPDPDATFKWRTGLFYSDGDLRGDSGSISPAGENPTLSETKSDTYAFFGQATYTLWEQLDLTAGVRLTYDYRNMQRTDIYPPNFFGPGAVAFGANLSDEFTAFQPKLAAAWHFTPALETYVSATEGYQSGGFNPFVDTPSLSEFSPERDWQFETGAKSSWLGNKVSVNASLFYTVADNYQTYRINPTDPLEAYLLNAHRADLYGAELELTARPNQNLDLSVGAGYTDARYSRFTEPAAASPTGSPMNLDGKAISFVPEFTANASARYRLPRYHLFFHGEVVGVGRYHLDDSYDVTSGPVTQDAYCLVNAQIGYEGKSFEIYFFAKNIFDTHYYNNALNLAQTSLLLQPGDPATYGVAATARF